MSATSTIEWTDATWSPVRGCTKITPGCDHCYAETFAERYRGVTGHHCEPGFDLRLVPAKLAEPLRWKTPKMIFVNSMSDLFHKDVPDDYVEAVCRTMERANWHTYQVLTKRSSLMRNLLQGRLRFAAELPHIWWGVSVEDRAHGLPRIEHLRQAPAALRFLSVEPLLEDLGEINLDGIHWVIVGGESGPGARPMDAAWVLSIKEQCEAARVPFLVHPAEARAGLEKRGHAASNWSCAQRLQTGMSACPPACCTTPSASAATSTDAPTTRTARRSSRSTKSPRPAAAPPAARPGSSRAATSSGVSAPCPSAPAPRSSSCPSRASNARTVAWSARSRSPSPTRAAATPAPSSATPWSWAAI